jgi:hypothetical protein
MEEALNELEKYEYEADDGLVKWLREQINNLDYAGHRTPIHLSSIP